jgi:ubiquinone/menaquinone biosynthesis C-methylase UbiE
MHAIQECLASISGGKVLDVATGVGGFIGTLLENLRNIEEITGIDIEERGAQTFARNFADKPTHFVKMDAARMTFPDAFFDTVCIANSLHHMADLPRVLSEMKRVLRPGGNFIVLEMYRDVQAETQLTHVLLHHWWAAVDRAVGISHNETYTRQEILAILEGTEMKGWEYTDITFADGDPKEPETTKYLDNGIDQYIKRCEGLPDQEKLRQRGEQLRQRVHATGFHSAASVIAIGKKESR